MTEEEELEQMIAEAQAEQEDGIETETKTEESTDDTTSTSEESKEEDDNGNSGDGHENESTTSEEEDEHNESELGDTKELDFEPIQVGEYTISSKEEMMTYLKKGADAFDTKPVEQTEESLVVEQGKLSAEVLKYVVEAKNGSKEALAKLAEVFKIDTLEIDDETSKEYKQIQEYNRPSEVDVVANRIMNDPVQKEAFQEVFNTINDKDFTEAISGTAKGLELFNGHIQSGMAQQIMPKAKHAQNAYGGDLMGHYVRIGQEITDAKANESKQETRGVSDKEKELRSRASGNRGNQATKTTADTVDDIHDMSDEDFAEYQKNFTE